MSGSTNDNYKEQKELIESALTIISCSDDFRKAVRSTKWLPRKLCGLDKGLNDLVQYFKDVQAKAYDMGETNPILKRDYQNLYRCALNHKKNNL